MPWWAQKESGNCIPQQQSWDLPCTTRRMVRDAGTAMGSASCWKHVQLLQSRARAACQASCSAAPCSTPPGEGATRCQTGQGPLTWKNWAACKHPACMLGQARAARLLRQALANSLSSLHAHTLSYWRETYASYLCLAIFVPQTSEQSSDIQSFSFTVPKSFSYLKAAAPPNKSFSIAYSSRDLWEWIAASRPKSSGFTWQVYPQVIWQTSSARWTGEKTSMNLQTRKRCHNSQCSADTLQII